MSPTDTSPIFILGRQHSGNTLLAAVFDNVPGVLGMKGEGTFFEHWAHLDRLGLEERVRQLVDILGRSDAPHLSPEARGELQSALLEHCAQARNGSDLAAGVLYARGMEHLAAQRGKQRWAQKATSYIFYVESILRAFPRAKLIFLVRNPLDLAASLKQRGRRDALLRMAFAWNKGLRLAQDYQARHPQNFLLVRYEDLVGAAEATAQKIFEFCGLEFRPDYLRVPHLNPAEAPYRLEGAPTGMDSSRAFRYRAILTAGEEAAVRLVVTPELLARHYPELRAAPAGWRPSDAAAVAGLAFRGAAAVLGELWQNFFSGQGHTLERLWRRLT